MVKKLGAANSLDILGSVRLEHEEEIPQERILTPEEKIIAEQRAAKQRPRLFLNAMLATNGPTVVGKAQFFS